MKCVADGEESSKVEESCPPLLSLGPFWIQGKVANRAAYGEI